MYAHIARQAIFDENREPMGYELLYRDGNRGNAANVRDGNAATRSVLSDALTVFGFPKLTEGKRAFIIFTRDLLLDDFPRLADPKDIVVELQQTVRLDNLLAGKLEKLRQDGYVLALNNYTGDERFDELLPLFNIIKVDFHTTTAVMQKLLARTLSGSQAHLVACKVESEEVFQYARELGFRFFEGYHLARPKRLSKKIPSLAASSYGVLMSELTKPEVDFDLCSRVIESDVVLTYMLLRQVQSANYYRGNVISDIKQGIVMLGEEELRRWIWLVLARQNSVTHTDGLSRQAYLRGKFIEGLMRNCGWPSSKNEGFLLGMFSLLDRIMGVQMYDILQDLNLTPALKAALLGQEENEYSAFLQYAMIYEMADDRLWFPEIGLHLSREQVEELYDRCAAETDAAFKSLGGRKKK